MVRMLLDCEDVSCDSAHDGTTDRETSGYGAVHDARRIGRYLMRLGVQREEEGFLFEVTQGEVFVVPSRAVSRDTV